MCNKGHRMKADAFDIKTGQLIMHWRAFQSHRAYFKGRGMKAEVSGLVSGFLVSRVKNKNPSWSSDRKSSRSVQL